MRNPSFFRYGLLVILMTIFSALRVTAQENPYDIRPYNGRYCFSYTETPESLVPIDPAYTAIYRWESSSRPLDGFATISGATAATYTFSGPLSQTTYFRRGFRMLGGPWLYSNTIKIEVVSVNWEDINYVRVHTTLLPGQTNWTVIDQLPIGQKLQTTTYVDGMGRSIQQVGREAATPATGNTWGDIVLFSKQDALGREPKQYLPYTTTTESGKYKTNPVNEQTAYYLSNYNETSAFSETIFDNSPLDRITTGKSAGTSWAAATGTSVVHELNELSDDVKIFGIGYTSGDIPVLKGVYDDNMLYKKISQDENGKNVIEYVDRGGRSILIKVQLEDSPSGPYDGWICTYNVYDDFGLLRYSIQPEGVKWLVANSWSFAATNGTMVLDEQCFRYEYDEKKRQVLKKSPGAAALIFIYDNRDRLIFRQDGNQRSKSTAEWSVTLYDELDRPVLMGLYGSSETAAALQARLNSASAISSIVLTAPSANITVSACPFSAAELNNASLTTIHKLAFYDDYNYAGVVAFNTSFDNLLAYPTGGETISATNRTLGLPTGQKTRVLGTTTFLSTTVYYDSRTRHIQTIDENIKSGIDITTNQYQWSGRLLSSNHKHSATGTGYTNFSIVTKNNFDKIGRLTSREKKYGGNAFINVASFDYDDLGRLKTKHLAPGYAGSGGTELESLTYSYNLHSRIIGINKDYALKTPGSYNKWAHFFGLYLGYDNRDNVFASGKLTGHLTGVVWNSQGDDAQRKFDFSYDNADRLVSAVFKEKQLPSDTWSSTTMDFSVGGAGSTGTRITYDLNGNLLSMFHKGVVPGNATPLTFDDLQYEYASFSNKLNKVTDNGNGGSANGKLGDFKDGTNGNVDDYIYDDNGNLVVDLNKDVKELAGVSGANGIRYNFMGKPEEIRIVGKGVIKIVYDADGTKLQRSFTTEGSSVTKTVFYVNQFVYEENSLQYITFEEGRIRPITAVNETNGLDFRELAGSNIALPDGKTGVFDYFIRDHQSNVRMILTQEVHKGGNSCTMESARATNEEPIFGQVDATGSPTAANEVAARYAKSNVPGWTGNTSEYVSRISATTGKKVGPNTLLKVMAGDKVSATTIYYYPAPVVNGTGTSVLTDLLGSLIQTISGSPVTNSVVKDGATGINTLLNGSIPFSTATSPDANNIAGTAPKAYLTLLFFDERFNFVAENSQTLRVSQAGDGANPLTMIGVKAPKNGYAYVYVSNESSEPVYFDDLQVSHERGRILEENHYYTYGLRIAAISSRKIADGNAGVTKNNFLYQGEFSELDEDINWNDFSLRNYDPQIGRWVQKDPFDEFASGYEGMGNDPVNLTDPSGGNVGGLFSGLGQFGKTAVMTLGGALIGQAGYMIAGGKDFKGALFGAAAGLIGSFNISLPGGTSSLSVAQGVTASVSVTVNITMVGVAIVNQQTDEGYRFFSSSDIAAFDWAWQHRYLGMNVDGGAVEWSSLIFEVEYYGKKYYTYTDAVRFENAGLARVKSPGIDGSEHYPIPKEGKVIGMIHLHWKGSENDHSSNTGFSDRLGSRDAGDKYKMGNQPNEWFYVIGSTGILMGRFPGNYPPDDPRNPNVTSAGEEYELGRGFYSESSKDIQQTGRLKYITNAQIKPCYIREIKKRQRGVLGQAGERVGDAAEKLIRKIK